MKWVNVGPRPGTSQYTLDQGGHRDEMHIIMIDVDGKITGTPGQLLERYINVSKASDAKTTTGEVNYYPTVIYKSLITSTGVSTRLMLELSQQLQLLLMAPSVKPLLPVSSTCSSLLLAPQIILLAL